jgi:NAD(P)-dependent dehydrogenase (short-subunit alcohol dehydrogenase family)
MRLENKVCVVTGGSSGIGRAIATLFAREGARVVIGDVTTNVREGGDPTADVIAAAGGVAHYRHCDVSVWGDVDALVAEAVDRFGSLDVMVNNAATVGKGLKLLDTDEAEWDHVMAVNAKGVFFGCKRAVQQMLTQPLVGDARGRIVNISSQHGMVCAPSKLAYGTGKAAAVYITRQVAVDYAEEGIICNAVAPGRILTGKPDSSAGSDPLAYSKMRTPMPRLGRSEDVARAALFLASEDASYVTGHNLMVDGGWMAF